MARSRRLRGLARGPGESRLSRYFLGGQSGHDVLCCRDEQYKSATSYAEFLELGGSRADFLSDQQRGFIEVDEFMKTNLDWVYAIGDIVNTPWLAHVASKEGILAVDHFSGKSPRPLNYGRVPNCTYCTPEVASVGLTEAAAREQGYDVKVSKFPFSAIGKANILGKGEGFVKIVSESKYDELLGMHIVGPKATELITEATLALELEATIEEILHTIHPHPTLAEAVGEAAHAVTGHTIHI